MYSQWFADSVTKHLLSNLCYTNMDTPIQTWHNSARNAWHILWTTQKPEVSCLIHVFVRHNMALRQKCQPCYIAILCCSVRAGISPQKFWIEGCSKCLCSLMKMSDQFLINLNTLDQIMNWVACWPAFSVSLLFSNSLSGSYRMG